MSTQAAVATIKKPGLFHFVASTFLPSSWKVVEPKVKRNKKQILLYILSKLALYYVLFCPLVLMPFYNTAIFHPCVSGSFNDTDVDGSIGKNMFFKSADGTRLHGWYFPQANSRKTVLLSHGNAGNLTQRKGVIKMLLATGASVFIYDYRGFGLSRGSVSVNGSCEDGIAAFDYLVKELKIPANSIVLYGESLGTGISGQIASKRKCAGVVLQSAFRSIPLFAREKFPLFSVYPDWSYPFNNLDTLSYVKGEHPNLLILHGKNDALIPSKNASSLFEAASGNNKTLALLDDCGHNDVPEHISEEAYRALKTICN